MARPWGAGGCAESRGPIVAVGGADDETVVKDGEVGKGQVGK